MLTNKNKYDVVIIGGGLSGLISAFQAADKGLKTLVLEKGRNLGGSGNYVEGLCAVGTEMQKAKGINLYSFSTSTNWIKLFSLWSRQSQFERIL